MARQTLYVGLDLSNVEPTLVRSSGGNLGAAVNRSELNLEVSKLDTVVASKLGLNEVGALYKSVLLAEQEGVTRSVTTTELEGVSYTFTTFDCLLDGWYDTKNIWRSAFFEGEEQIDILGRFFVIGEGMVRIIFQSDEEIPDNKYKMFLQRVPPIPPVAQVPLIPSDQNNLN